MLVCMIFILTCTDAQEITINIFPVLPETIIATNYVNLKLISTVIGSPLACHWYKDGRTSNFYEFIDCLPNTSSGKFKSVCESTENVIMSITGIIAVFLT